MWLFRTRIGEFRIQKLQNARYGLYLEDELLGSYHSPDGAAEAVHTCSTGHAGWDGSGPVCTPGDLSDWQYMEEPAQQLIA
jgi:hypothetical protein